MSRAIFYLLAFLTGTKNGGFHDPIKILTRKNLKLLKYQYTRYFIISEQIIKIFQTIKSSHNLNSNLVRSL